MSLEPVGAPHPSFGRSSPVFTDSPARSPDCRKIALRPGRKMNRVVGLLAIGLLSVTIRGQSRKPPPVIDMHVHANATIPPERAIAIFDSMNVRYVFLAVWPNTRGQWAGADASRFLPVSGSVAVLSRDFVGELERA